MNVVYSSSDSYSELCGISIVSLFENNKDVDEIKVYIINNNITEINMNRLLDTGKKYNRNIIFVDTIDIEGITKTNIYVGRWNIGTFFRLYLSTILPKDVDRLIYLDCDMIIRYSLNEVYNLDMGNCLVAGADDCRSDLYREDIGCKPGQVYINNGFMLIDLKKWREQDVESKFSDFITKRKGDLTYMDQAPMNGVLVPNGQIYELKPIYNAQRIFFDFNYKQLLRLRKPNHHLSFEEYNETITDPIVVHFTPTFLTGTRPWQVKDNHKFRNEYLYYKSISEWKDIPLRKDDRKKKKKLMTIICKLTPKFILIPIMSYLHSTWYPKKRIKIAKENIK